MWSSSLSLIPRLSCFKLELELELDLKLEENCPSHLLKVGVHDDSGALRVGLSKPAAIEAESGGIEGRHLWRGLVGLQ